jgi:N,N'-diacetyllegionaminate synthase
MNTFVIAEIGSCHDMDLAKARHLIDVAKIAGADAAKFQYWSSAERMTHRRKAGPYLDIYRQYAMPVGWLSQLHAYCHARGIDFMCSSYLPEDVDVVAPFVQRFKIASFEANDAQHLVAHVKHLCAFGVSAAQKQLYISMGMGAELEPVRRFLMQPLATTHSEPNPETVRFLHCVSAYPAPLDQLNLKRLRWDWDRRQGYNPVPFSGFSDHAPSELVWTGAVAVAAGASIIERHLRSGETNPSNPDYGHAMAPDDFMRYVKNIRDVETMLGLGSGGTQTGEVAAETPMRAYRVRE